MKKKEFLKRINGGFERGSRTKLAKMLGIKPQSVIEWFTGRSRPSEQNVQKMAGLFSIDEQELWDMFNNNDEDISLRIQGSGNVAANRSATNIGGPVKLALMEKEVELIKKMLENLDLRLKLLENAKTTRRI